MNTPTKNRCPPGSHDWVASAWEPGRDECAWPNCGATRESPLVAEPTLPPVLVEAQGRRAA